MVPKFRIESEIENQRDLISDPLITEAAAVSTDATFPKIFGVSPLRFHGMNADGSNGLVGASAGPSAGLTAVFAQAFTILTASKFLHVFYRVAFVDDFTAE